MERTEKDEDVERKWENIRGSVLKAADLLGDTKKHSNAEWFDEECRRAIGDKDEARSRCEKQEVTEMNIVLRRKRLPRYIERRRDSTSWKR